MCGWVLVLGYLLTWSVFHSCLHCVWVQRTCVLHSAYYTADSMGISVLGIEFVSVALVSYDSWICVCLWGHYTSHSLLCSLIPRPHIRVERVWWISLCVHLTLFMWISPILSQWFVCTCVLLLTMISSGVCTIHCVPFPGPRPKVLLGCIPLKKPKYWVGVALITSH